MVLGLIYYTLTILQIIIRNKWKRFDFVCCYRVLKNSAPQPETFYELQCKLPNVHLLNLFRPLLLSLQLCSSELNRSYIHVSFVFFHLSLRRFNSSPAVFDCVYRHSECMFMFRFLQAGLFPLSLFCPPSTQLRECAGEDRVKLKINKHSKADPTAFTYAAICFSGVFSDSHLARWQPEQMISVQSDVLLNLSPLQHSASVTWDRLRSSTNITAKVTLHSYHSQANVITKGCSFLCSPYPCFKDHIIIFGLNHFWFKCSVKSVCIWVCYRLTVSWEAVGLLSILCGLELRVHYLATAKVHSRQTRLLGLLPKLEMMPPNGTTDKLH